MTAVPGPVIDGMSCVRHLGSGGFSDVYLYEQQRPRMLVAVKILTRARLSPVDMAQFAAEAETMAELADHPYIVQVFTTGVTRDGRPYLVMKYYPSANLGARAASERFGVADVLRTGIKIGSAVETAHRAGILHRDIKPANILVSQFGEPVLADFGIAGRAVDVADDSDLGVSVPWSPPEILSKDSNGTKESDVYSLAATLWHLLAGRSPFEVTGGDNSSRAIQARVLRVPPPVTGRADVPPSLDRLLQQAMAKEPHRRPQTALRFILGLQAVEQELHYARTEAAVSDLSTPLAGTSMRADASPGSTRVRASAPRDAASSAPPRIPTFDRPVANPTADVGKATVPPAPPVDQEVFIPPTSLRGARPLQGLGAAQDGGRAGGGLDIAGPEPHEQRTSRRGQPPSGWIPEVESNPGSDASVGAPDRPRKLRAGHVVIGAVAAAVIAAAVAFSMSSSDSGGSAPSAPLPGRATDQGGFGSSALSAPSIQANYDRSRRILTFHWSSAGSRTSANGYVYSYLSNPGRQIHTSQTSAQVTTTDPSSVCIQVAEVTDQGSRGPDAQLCG